MLIIRNVILGEKPLPGISLQGIFIKANGMFAQKLVSTRANERIVMFQLDLIGIKGPWLDLCMP